MVGGWGAVVDAMPQRGGTKARFISPFKGRLDDVLTEAGFVPPPITPGKNATITPYPSASISSNATVSTSSCTNNCVVELPALTAIHWIPEVQVVYTTEITVATVTILYTTVYSYTLEPKTLTGYDIPLSSLYEVNTDDNGTATVTWSTTNTDGFYDYFSLTYPTSFVDYASSYGWGGVLQTSKQGADPICATATPKLEGGLLMQHPEYPQSKQVSPDQSDPFGTSYIPLWIPYNEEPDHSFFSSAFPDVLAFQSCSPLSQKKPETLKTYYTEKPVTVTTTVYTTVNESDRVILPQPTATGWDDDGNIVPVPERPSRKLTTSPPPHTSIPQLTKPLIDDPQPTADGWGDDLPPMPIITKSRSPRPPTQPQEQNQGPNPEPEPTKRASPRPFPTRTPIFTLIPTTISGTSTQLPAFLLPDATGTRTLSLGVTVTLDNGQTTTLTAPPIFFTYLPTTINGESTDIPRYLISGASTATLRQLVTLENGQTGILVPPTGEGGVWREVETTIGGTGTVVPVYVVSGRTTVYETPEETGAETNFGSETALGPKTEGEIQTGTGFAKPEETGKTSGAAARAVCGLCLWSGFALGAVILLGSIY